MTVNQAPVSCYCCGGATCSTSSNRDLVDERFILYTTLCSRCGAIQVTKFDPVSFKDGEPCYRNYYWPPSNGSWQRRGIRLPDDYEWHF